MLLTLGCKVWDVLLHYASLISWLLAGLNNGLSYSLDILLLCMMMSWIESISLDLEMIGLCNSVDSNLKTPTSGSSRVFREDFSLEDLATSLLLVALLWPVVEPAMAFIGSFLLLLVPVTLRSLDDVMMLLI